MLKNVSCNDAQGYRSITQLSSISVEFFAIIQIKMIHFILLIFVVYSMRTECVTKNTDWIICTRNARLVSYQEFTFQIEDQIEKEKDTGREGILSQLCRKSKKCNGSKKYHRTIPFFTMVLERTTCILLAIFDWKYAFTLPSWNVERSFLFVLNIIYVIRKESKKCILAKIFYQKSSTHTKRARTFFKSSNDFCNIYFTHNTGFS